MYAIPWSRTRASNCFHKENAKSVFYSNWKFLTFWLFTFLNGNIHQIHRILQLGREKWNHPKKQRSTGSYEFSAKHIGHSPPQIYSTFITTGAKENASKKQTTRSANSFIWIAVPPNDKDALSFVFSKYFHQNRLKSLFRYISISIWLLEKPHWSMSINDKGVQKKQSCSELEITSTTYMKVQNSWFQTAIVLFN